MANRTINKFGFAAGLDEIVIYGTSLCIVVPFVLKILALHYVTPNEKKFWSHAALIFSTIYAVFVSANYVVQLTTVIPMKLRGAGKKLASLSKYPILYSATLTP